METGSVSLLVSGVVAGMQHEACTEASIRFFRLLGTCIGAASIAVKIGASQREGLGGCRLRARPLPPQGWAKL